jgi:hypothetical protein
MARILLGVALAAALLAGTQAAAGARPDHQIERLRRHGLAAYEWHPAEQLTRRVARPRLRFLHRQGFRIVYLDLGEYLDVADQPDSPERDRRLEELEDSLRGFVADASRFGLAVHGVGGGPNWTDERRRYLGPELVRLVADYNAEVDADERLRGVQFDIEPYADPGFFADEQASLQAYLATIVEIVGAYRDVHYRPGNGRLQLGLAVPFWFDAEGDAPGPVAFHGATKPAVYHVIDLVQDLYRAYLVVMAYRNVAAGPDGSIAHARSELAYARHIGADCGLVVGQQYTDVQPAKVTFFGHDRRAFRREAEQIVDAFDGFRQFRGLSVDDLDAYRAAG